jgi:hypothetical protein
MIKEPKGVAEHHLNFFETLIKDKDATKVEFYKEKGCLIIKVYSGDEPIFDLKNYLKDQTIFEDLESLHNKLEPPKIMGHRIRTSKRWTDYGIECKYVWYLEK